MNLKPAHRGYFLGLLVLLAILVQSAHTFGHLAERLSEPHCDHHYTEGSTFNHSHHGAEPCFICAFAFSAAPALSGAPSTFTVATWDAEQPQPSFSSSFTTFCGSLFTHRGPPMFIV